MLKLPCIYCVGSVHYTMSYVTIIQLFKLHYLCVSQLSVEFKIMLLYVSWYLHNKQTVYRINGL
jgi:hypothetical protein